MTFSRGDVVEQCCWSSFVSPTRYHFARLHSAAQAEPYLIDHMWR
jgi:hypothetical protein